MTPMPDAAGICHAIPAEIRNLDYSPLTDDDLVNIVLQRSEVLFDQPAPGRVIRAWSAGDDGPVRDVVARLGTEIATRAAAIIHEEYRRIRPHVLAAAPRRIADIGCGLAFIDLFIGRDLETDLVLIDIETGPHRHFGFRPEAAAYARLSIARALLEANGIAPGRIMTLNPRRQPLDGAGAVDLAFSFLSCGFHYPVDSYLAFFRDQLRGGTVMLDLRHATAQAQLARLSPLGEITQMPGHPKARRIKLQIRAEP